MTESQIVVHLPDDLADKVQAAARIRGTSVNRLIVDALEREIDRMGRDADFASRAKDLLERDRELLERLTAWTTT